MMEVKKNFLLKHETLMIFPHGPWIWVVPFLTVRFDKDPRAGVQKSFHEHQNLLKQTSYFHLFDMLQIIIHYI